MFKANIQGPKDMANCLFLGADIHKNNHSFAALNGLQQTIGQCLASDSKEDLSKLRDWIEKIRGDNRVMIGLEDTNGHGRVISRFLFQAGYPVYEINPGLVAQRRIRTAHRDKSDQKDALLVAKVLMAEINNLSEIRINSKVEAAKQLKGLANDYDSLVKNQTRTKNKLHKLLYQQYGTEYLKKFKSPFSAKALKYWRENNEGDYIGLDSECSELTVELPQIDNIRKTRIKQKAEELLFIRKHLKDLSKLMEQALLSHKNLLSLPGCGIILASRIIGEIQDINKFSSSSKLAKYAGVSPREVSSGQKIKHRTSKSGNRQLNKTFYRIALSQITKRADNQAAINYYQRKISEGKSKKRALKSLIRKNVDIVYAMLKSGSEYDVQRHVDNKS